MVQIQASYNQLKGSLVAAKCCALQKKFTYYAHIMLDA